MGFVQDMIQPILRHLSGLTIIGDPTLKLGLWYTTTSQAYLQRTTIFDNSWLSSSTADAYVALRLKQVLGLSEVHIYEKVKDCFAIVDAFGEEKLTDLILHIASDKSLFFNFWEKARNSLAHGAFNSNNGLYYMLNQYRPKPDADVNFLLQTSADLNLALLTLWKEFNDSLTSVVEFKFNCLSDTLRLTKKQGRYYSETEGCFVVIDDAFKFSSDKHKAEIQSLLSQYKTGERIDIIINENIGSIAEKNRISEDGLVRVIPQSKLIETYGIEEIIFTKCVDKFPNT